MQVLVNVAVQEIDRPIAWDNSSAIAAARCQQSARDTTRTDALERLLGILAVLPGWILPDRVHHRPAENSIPPRDLHGQAGEGHQGVHHVRGGLPPHPGVQPIDVPITRREMIDAETVRE